jgi:hypothetical protein
MSRFDLSFPRQVFLTLAVAACCGAYPLLKYATTEILEAVAAGALITTLNVLAGYAAIEYSHGKSASTFLRVVLGGMGIRMLAVGSVIVVLVKVFDVHVQALIWSIVFFTVVYLALEIMFIQKKFGDR